SPYILKLKFKDQIDTQDDNQPDRHIGFRYFLPVDQRFQDGGKEGQRGEGYERNRDSGNLDGMKKQDPVHANNTSYHQKLQQFFLRNVYRFLCEDKIHKKGKRCNQYTVPNQMYGGYRQKTAQYAGESPNQHGEM